RATRHNAKSTYSSDCWPLVQRASGSANPSVRARLLRSFAELTLSRIDTLRRAKRGVVLPKHPLFVRRILTKAKRRETRCCRRGYLALRLTHRGRGELSSVTDSTCIPLPRFYIPLRFRADSADNCKDSLMPSLSADGKCPCPAKRSGVCDANRQGLEPLMVLTRHSDKLALATTG